MKVYLAGGKSPWRAPIIRRWEKRGIECYDPFKDSRQNAVFEFTNDDLAAIAECDLLFGVHDYHVYGGLALEFGYAYALGKKIIYVCQQPRVDAMMAGVATAVFTDIIPARNFVEERYVG